MKLVFVIIETLRRVYLIIKITINAYQTMRRVRHYRLLVLTLSRQMVGFDGCRQHLLSYRLLAAELDKPASLYL